MSGRVPRMARVNELLREAIAEQIEELSDPRIGLVTVTGVEVSPDLHSGVVYYSALDGDAEDTNRALNAAAPHIQEYISRNVRVKYTPRLTFKVDESIATAQRIEEILRESQS